MTGRIAFLARRALDSAGLGAGFAFSFALFALPGTAAPPVDTARLDAVLRGCPARAGSGCALVVVTRDGVVYERGAGRFTKDTVVPIASASKWLSGAVVLSLADEGRLSLDDAAGKHLPELRGAPGADALTLRRLFAHTSGFPAEARCRNDKSTSLEACVKRIAGMTLRSRPGAELFYGGVSMHVGGRVAEVAGKKPWNELFLERVARPLGMTRTDFHAYGPTRNPRPAGDARSSAAEYARFLRMLLAGGTTPAGARVLSERAVEALLSDQTEGARIVYTPLAKLRGLDPVLPLARYGVGVFRVTRDDGSVEHVSPGALGSFPWLDEGRGIGFFLVTRSAFSRVAPVFADVRAVVRGDARKPAAQGTNR